MRRKKLIKGVLGWNEKVTNKTPPQCQRCIHYFEKEDGRKCKAFPDREIPQDYFTEKVKHRIVIGNQKGDYIYEPKERYLRYERRQKEVNEKLVSDYNLNKERLPKMIIKKLQDYNLNLETLEKLEIRSSGPTRRKFDFEIKFFPEEKRIQFNLEDFEGREVARKIIQALEARNLPPEFKLIIFKNGEYKYR